MDCLWKELTDCFSFFYPSFSMSSPDVADWNHQPCGLVIFKKRTFIKNKKIRVDILGPEGFHGFI